MKAAMLRHWKKTEAMREGYDRGYAEGRAEGCEAGRAEGYEEGLKDGMAEPGQPPAASGSGAAAEQQTVGSLLPGQTLPQHAGLQPRDRPCADNLGRGRAGRIFALQPLLW